MFNWDILALGITTAGIALLGFTIYFNNKKSITNKTFLLFSLITIVWSTANYFQYQPASPIDGLWIARAIIFLACWHAFIFFQLCYVFPDEKVVFPRLYRVIVIPIIILVSGISLTPLVFDQASETSSVGVVTQIHNGPAIVLFGFLVLFLISAGIYMLVAKALLRHGIERRQIAMMSVGVFITFVCIVIFNLILPAIFNNAGFLPFSAMFMLPFIGCTAFSIFRYHLLNIKILATEMGVFFLSIATLLQVVFSKTGPELLLRIGMFGLVVAFGINLIKSIIHEVEQREIIQKQSVELEIVNKQQENLLHFISHEIKGYLTKGEAGFAAIVEGDFGVVSEDLKHMAQFALTDTRKGVATIIDILEAANLKKGTVSFTKKTFDFSVATKEVVEGLVHTAEEKGLTLTYITPAIGTYLVLGDEEKMRSQVIRNLIDNAIRYTPSGSITVQLIQEKSHLCLTVEDTGLGITNEDMLRLFTEGGHGANSIKVNVHSTGFGLFIAKQVVVAHGGTIHAESKGMGLGARFVVDLPLDVPSA